MTTTEAILSFLKGRPRGEPVGTRQMLHLGKRPAVDQALARLVRRGRLVRVMRGFYALPIPSRFGPLPPEPAKAIEVIARLKGEHISPAGASAANALGLSTQVPLRRTYITSGRSRRLTLSGETIELRHGAPLAELPEHERLLRAIEWLGPNNVEEAKSVLAKLPSAARRKLARSANVMPSWMAKAVSEAAHGGQHLQPRRAG